MPVNNPTPNVSSRYGAPMGRHTGNPDPDASGRFTLQRVPINSGGYDSGGAYWGLGSPLYWYCSPDGTAEGFFRVERENVREAFEARGGVRIGEPGYDDFARRFPRWSAGQGTREAAKDIVRAACPDATFYR